mmetsp:Transcript_12554/g.25571  ORF Transcript_12554/g.25571 Transcript_12554/m.25571 type:complete len:337 (+) Transcript_12554:1-1011(+)
MADQASPNRFKVAEKKYKIYKGKDKRRRKTDFSECLDLSRDYKGPKATRVDTKGSSSSQEYGGEIWKILPVPGLYVIRGALDMKQQVYWAMTSVSEFSRCEHTNLTNLHGAQPDHWKKAVEEHDVGKGTGFHGLRWASLGYHYDWTKRLYYKNEKSDFPDELAKLASTLAAKVGYQVKSEAAIVNFYPFDASMGGHVDDAELTLSYPIVSVSLGCSAVFLIGGKTKDIEPTAILVRSGDVVIMGGESRTCYHGVPRIIKDTCPKLVEYLTSNQSQDPHASLLAKYLQSSRINMNIRQVVDANDNFDSAGKEAYPRSVSGDAGNKRAPAESVVDGER